MKTSNTSNEYAPRINFSTAGFQKYLEALIFAGIILIAIFPLIGDYGNLLFPLGRDIFFRIIVEIIFSLYLILIILDRSNLPRPSLILIFLSLFLFINGLATIFSVQPQFSFWGNIFRGQGFFSQIHYFLFFIVLAGTLKNWRHWKIIIHVAAFVSAPVLLIGFSQVLSGTIRIQSTLNNPTFYGAYLLLIIFITLAFLLTEKQKTRRTILFLILSFQIINLYYARSLGSYLGLTAGIIVFSSLFIPYRLHIRQDNLWKKSKYSREILFGIVIFTILIITAGSLIIPNKITRPGFWNERLHDALEGRLEPWQAAWQGIKEKPLLGFGPENFIVVSDKYFSGKTDESGYPWWDKAHNFIFEIGATTGIIGLAAYLGIWISAFWSLFRKPKSWQSEPPLNNYIKIGLAATFFAYLISGLFNPIDSTTNLIYVAFLLSLANFLATNHAKSRIDYEHANRNKKAKKLASRQKIAVAVLLILSSPILIFVIGKYNLGTLTANLKLNHSADYMQKGYIEMGFGKYEEILKINDPAVNHYARYYYGNDAISLAEQRKYLGTKQDLENIRRAIDLQKENARGEWPYFARNWISAGILANFLMESGKSEYRELADEYFKKALELSPKRSNTWLEWSKTDIIGGDFNGAQEKTEKALALNPNYGKSWWRYALLNIYQNKKNLAVKNIQRASDLGYDISSNTSLNELKEVYWKTENWEESIKILQKLAEKNPDALEYKINLAYAFKNKGDKAMAKQILQNLAETAPPSFQPEIKQFLTELE